jgi:hypothetical protein
MALSKQKISLPLAQGLDTKTDDQQKNIGTLDRLENVVFDSLKELKKRNGYEKVPNKLIDGTEITAGKSLSKFNDKELCLLTETNFYSYSQTIEKWTNKGSLYSAFPTSEAVVRNSRQQKNIDALSQENLNVYVYEDKNGVYCTIKDNDTQNVLLSNFLIAAGAVKPKVATINNSVHVTYIVGNDIRYRKINLLNPTVVEAEQTVVSDVDPTDQHYDAKGYTDRIIIGYNSSTIITIIGILSDGTLTSAIGITGETAEGGIAIEQDSLERVLITYSDNTDVKFAIAPLNLGGLILSPVVIENIANVVNVTTIEESVNNYKTFYEITDANEKNYYIKKNTVDISGTVGTSEVVIRSVGLASKAFKYNDNIYINTLHSSTLQSTYFISDENGVIVSQISPLEGGDFFSENGLPKVTEQVDGNFLITTQIKGRTITDEGTFFSLLGVNSTVLDFEISNPYQNSELSNNLHISGGILRAYDGSVITEHGFLVFPEDLTAGTTAVVREEF